MDSFDHALKLFRERQERAATRLARAKQAEIDREIEEAMRVTHAAIAAAERRALKILNVQVGSKRAQALFRTWWTSPGLMTVAGATASPIITTSRPISSEGRVSFHFDVRHVTTGGLIVDLLEGRVPWRAIGKFKDLGSVAHQKYIEREDGVETFDPGEAAHHQGYIERDGATETIEREHSSWGTISSDPQERLAFWQALEVVENKPSPTVLAFDPAADELVWAKAIRSRDFPGRVFTELGAGCRSVVVSEDEALMVFRAFARAGFVASAKHDPEKPAPVRFDLGRGGNVQTRMIVSLPHEMTARERLALAKDYTAKFEELGMPFWAVIHAPGPNNDARNYHLHINLATRPAQKIPHPLSGELVWDFSVLATKTYANDTRRIIRPFTQKKIRAMNARSWIPIERARFARIANKHLERGEYDKRLDPRTHEAMGLPPPRPHLPKTDYGRERRGLTTPRGVTLANQQWDDDVRSIAFAIEGNGNSTGAAKTTTAKESDGVPNTNGDEIAYLHALSHVALRITSRFRLRSSNDELEDERAAEALAEDLDAEISAELERLKKRNAERKSPEIEVPTRVEKPRNNHQKASAGPVRASRSPRATTPGNTPERAVQPTPLLPSLQEAAAALAALKTSNSRAPKAPGNKPGKQRTKNPAKSPEAMERKRVMIARQKGRGGIER